ncbi:MAG TPA: VOC family protein [Candidatus Pristimantibacillus sp.]|jgi:catechol 2,3-dioxygenase-like lactoylglutathione lyase family enzyme|nr:VOC family protein [Candidatus Pristimantibacillus sp.]
MKLVSVSGIVFYAKDMAKTAEFYKTLGFRIDKNEPDHLSVGLNWFWMDFHPQDKEDKPDFQKEAVLEPKGAGLFVYVKVDDVDEFYQGLLAKGLKPSSEPRDWPWGNREFSLRDPSGYKLVFFNKSK